MNIKQQILQREGFLAQPTRVGGSLMVGIGYNLSSRGLDPLSLALGRNVHLEGLCLTEGEAWAILEADVARAEAALRAGYPGLEALDPVRWRAALDLALRPGVDPARFTEAILGLRGRDWTAAAMAVHRALGPGRAADEIAHMVLTGREFAPQQ